MTETDQTRQKRRKRTIAIILLSFPALCIIMCGIAFLGLKDALVLDQEKVKDIANQISDYDLPDGFQETAGSSIFNLTTVFITDENTAIWLSQAPLETLLPDPKRFLRRFFFPEPMCSAMSPSVVYTQVDTKDYIIRGGKSNVMIFDDTSEYHYHAWAARFKGKDGYVQIIIFAPQETWDETIAETFINSLRE